MYIYVSGCNCGVWIIKINDLTISIPELTCGVVLTSEFVDKILWCDHLNKTSSAVLWHGTICFSVSYKIKFGIFLEF